MFAVYQLVSDVFGIDEIQIGEFETEAEAEQFKAECEAEDIKEFGEIIDEYIVERA